MALSDRPLMPSTPNEDRKVIDFTKGATAEDAANALPEGERELFLKMLAAQKEQEAIRKSNQRLVEEILSGEYKTPQE